MPAYPRCVVPGRGAYRLRNYTVRRLATMP
jgi:hypothetical protein